MSQPEMQPGGPANEEGTAPGAQSAQGSQSAQGTHSAHGAWYGGGEENGTGGTGAAGGTSGPGGGPGRPGHAGDLTGGPFPQGDWGEPAERLDELYRWVEAGALHTVGWYLADRVRKRRFARVLRGATALTGTAGAMLPLLDLTGALPGAAGWGYVALLLGAASLACDRYLGLTSGWMRALATAQAVQRRLQTLQFDWASECVREVLGPTEGTASEAAERCLTVLRRFTEDMTELVRAETADWLIEFRSGPAPLVMQSMPMGGGRGEGAVPPAGRFPLPPGARPNMPRQRPPEAR
ncbi:SLATT domain-containing protein [Streptomyces sp. NRRL F-5135]|uniref:SLATT domain-containing protein n=1 Tax=Streptomyces sp. NRRL F-5135 TaxID=1463858 RepID=UPI0004CB4343|nr:SLATT domain-containing protein [Streptomyces sp. NRRL F-5135]